MHSISRQKQKVNTVKYITHCSSLVPQNRLHSHHDRHTPNTLVYSVLCCDMCTGLHDTLHSHHNKDIATIAVHKLTVLVLQRLDFIHTGATKNTGPVKCRWQWHQPDHMQVICPSHQTDNHQHLVTQVFTGWMPFLPPSQQRQSTEGMMYESQWKCDLLHFLPHVLPCNVAHSV